jgi:hypothetical protein
MILNLFSNIYYRYLNIISMSNNKYWLEECISKKSLPFSIFKRFKPSTCDLYYGEKYIGKTSVDHQIAIIKDSKMLSMLNKNNADCFNDDFLELSQMAYFVFCYLFTPSNSEANYIERWRVFFNALKHDKITSFGQTIKATVDLLTNLNNNTTPPEFANTLENCNIIPPISTEFGVVFDSNGLECKLLEYIVKIPNSRDRISVILVEKDGVKYYKLSKINEFSSGELVKNVMGYEYFKLNIDEFVRYKVVTEFMGDFSMMMVKGIYPDYKEDKHPTIRDKIIFDMVCY